MMMLVSVYVCTLKKTKTVYGKGYAVDSDTKGNHIKDGRNKVM